MNETWQQFSERIWSLKADFNPFLVQDGWISQVADALKRGENIPENILTSHSEIEFKDGIPYWRRTYE